MSGRKVTPNTEQSTDAELENSETGKKEDNGESVGKSGDQKVAHESDNQDTSDGSALEDKPGNRDNSPPERNPSAHDTVKSENLDPNITPETNPQARDTRGIGEKPSSPSRRDARDNVSQPDSSFPADDKTRNDDSDAESHKDHRTSPRSSKPDLVDPEPQAAPAANKEGANTDRTAVPSNDISARTNDADSTNSRPEESKVALPNEGVKNDKNKQSTDDIDACLNDTSIDSLAHLPEQERKAMRRRIYLILATCHALALLYSAAYWMQSGVLPYLTRKLHVGPLMFGYLQSTYAIFQFVGSPLFGRMGDLFGCKFALIVSFIGAALCYMMLGLAKSIFVLFLSRVPSLVIHSLQGTYMVITDVTRPAQRSDMIGKLGVSHGIGMILGSFFGGVITEAISEEAATFFAAALVLICAVITFIFIPSDTKKIRRLMDNLANDATPVPSMGKTLGFNELVSVLKMKHVAYILTVKAITAFPFGIFYAMFSMSIMDFFRLGPKVNGIVLGYVGILGMIVQGVAIGIITKYVTDASLVHHSTAMISVAFLFLVIVQDIYLFCIALIPLVIGGSISHIILTALVTKVVPIDDTGSALGLTLGMHALIRVFAPTLGGWMFANLGFYSFGLIGYIMTFLLSLYLYLHGRESYD